MKIYFAPMEGVTDGILRQTHSRIFGGVDVYCLPFHKLTQTLSLTTREELAEWYTALYEGWKDRFHETIALGRIKKLMEWPAGDDIRRKRLLRRAGDFTGCINAIMDTP